MNADGSKQTSKVSSDEDVKLMRKVADGDMKAFECLYHKFHPLLKKVYADYDDQHMSSEDLIQEVFTRLWQQRNNYRADSCFNTYLLAIARHTVNEKIRRSRRIRTISLDRYKDINRNLTLRMTQPETELYLRELTVVIEYARDKLTNNERQALEVSQKPDLSLDKASEKLGCSQEALRCRIKRARKRLRELLPFKFRRL